MCDASLLSHDFSSHRWCPRGTNGMISLGSVDPSCRGLWIVLPPFLQAFCKTRESFRIKLSKAYSLCLAKFSSDVLLSSVSTADEHGALPADEGILRLWGPTVGPHLFATAKNSCAHPKPLNHLDLCVRVLRSHLSLRQAQPNSTECQVILPRTSWLR